MGKGENKDGVVRLMEVMVRILFYARGGDQWKRRVVAERGGEGDTYICIFVCSNG